MSEHGPTRWAWAEVDLAAYEHNIAVLRRMVAPSAVWAVVKADAYGHGAVPVSRAALAAGVEGLCVAVTAEGVELRRAGIDAPILVLSEQPFDEIPEIIANRLTPTVYRRDYIDALAVEVVRSGVQPVGVHAKVDTGMHRVGAEPGELPSLVRRVNEHATTLRLAGVYTHFAVADDPAHVANVVQARRFAEALDAIAALPADVAVHAVNSAGAMAMPMQRRSFVRAGIATYGIVPGDGVAEYCSDLRPVMSLHARVSRVQRIAAGEGVSYGHRFVAARDTTIATLPIGYADGVPRVGRSSVWSRWIS